MVILHPSAYAGLPVLGDIELASPSAFRHDHIKALVPLPACALARGLSADPPSHQQAATQDLAQDVDLMIVVGGRESANTRHLAEVAREQGVTTYHVESAGEIEAAWLTGRESVGVAAGASTPDAVIDEVVERLHALAPA